MTARMEDGPTPRGAPDPSAGIPAIEGWWSSEGDAPHLLGTRCTKCGTYFFPMEKTFCRNPVCDSTELTQVPLSSTGVLWSYTNAGYPPPEPFIAAKLPFEPFAIAAVELEKERLTILGMVPAGISCADLKVGAKMELILDTLYEAEGRRYVTWKWKPVAS